MTDLFAHIPDLHIGVRDQSLTYWRDRVAMYQILEGQKSNATLHDETEIIVTTLFSELKIWLRKSQNKSEKPKISGKKTENKRSNEGGPVGWPVFETMFEW